MPEFRELTDPTDLRALAHPVRMAIMEQLSVFGPLTATELADRIDESPANCSWHLRKLAERGFVEEAGGGTGRSRPWRTASRGLSWNEQDTSEAAHVAGEALTALFVDREVARYAAARRWLRDDDPGWSSAAGSSQGAFWATQEELVELSEALRELATRFVDRLDHPEQRPAGSRLCTFMGWVTPAYEPDGRPVTEAGHDGGGQGDHETPVGHDGKSHGGKSHGGKTRRATKGEQ